ncbi:ABC transporter permease [Aeromicrobium wangtongii]|uniref:ABC transporter permease n=1 Tax=Aeromicrobium wangtongii TaxID=2969247 RepID=UPI0020174C3C|nr:ABC transporter permease [Aeromicrobium wangtongii]MCL3818285.1 ABC transporter permease [Aeromicrobium wangtongii]
MSSIAPHQESADVTEPTGPPKRAALSQVVERLWKSCRHLIPVIALLVTIIVIFAATNPYFLTTNNLTILLTSNTALWVIAIGMTAVMISGAVDLSLGAIVAFLAILFAKLIEAGTPGGVAVAVTVVAGAVIGGAVNGLLIGRLKLSFLLVTMASLTAFTGFVNLWSDTKSISVSSPVTESIAFGSVAGVNTSIVIMAAVLIVALYVQTRTYFGRDVYAVGGNPVAARLAGISATRTTVAVFAISGAAAAAAAIVGIGRSSAASPTVDNALPLQAIACVLLGGASIAGGSGGVGGTILGVLFLSTLGNGLSLSGISSHWQGVVTGVILVGAVLLNRFSEGGLAQLRGRRRGRPGAVANPGAQS